MPLRRRFARFAYRKGRAVLRRFGRRAGRRIGRSVRRRTAGTFRHMKTRIARRVRPKTLSALTRAYRRVMSVLDIDPGYYNNNDTQVSWQASSTVETNLKTYISVFDAIHSSGHRFKFKSINERIVFTPTEYSASSLAVARARVLYILCKDEQLGGITDLFDYPGDSTDFLTLTPPLKANTGITWTTLFDRTYTIRQTMTRDIAVRIPASVFYDGGSVQYGVKDGQQKNNFLYRLVFMQNPQFGVIMNVSRRVKYFDTGASGASVAALADRVGTLESKAQQLDQKITVLQRDKIGWEDPLFSEIAYTDGRLYQYGSRVINFRSGFNSGEKFALTFNQSLQPGSLTNPPAINYVSDLLAIAYAQAYGWQALWYNTNLPSKTDGYAAPAVGVSKP